MNILTSADINEKTSYFDNELRINDSFDMVRRDIIVCKRKCSFYFIDGLTKDEIMLRIMDLFMKLSSLDENALTDLETFCNTYIPYVEVETVHRVHC